MHRMPFLCGRLPRMFDTQGVFDDLCRLHRPGRNYRDDADGLHALHGTDLRAGLPGGCDQAERGRRGNVRVKTAVP